MKNILKQLWEGVLYILPVFMLCISIGIGIHFNLIGGWWVLVTTVVVFICSIIQVNTIDYDEFGIDFERDLPSIIVSKILLYVMLLLSALYVIYGILLALEWLIPYLNEWISSFFTWLSNKASTKNTIYIYIVITGAVLFWIMSILEKYREISNLNNPFVLAHDIEQNRFPLHRKFMIQKLKGLKHPHKAYALKDFTRDDDINLIFNESLQQYLKENINHHVTKDGVSLLKKLLSSYSHKENKSNFDQKARVDTVDIFYSGDYQYPNLVKNIYLERIEIIITHFLKNTTLRVNLQESIIENLYSTIDLSGDGKRSFWIYRLLDILVRNLKGDYEQFMKELEQSIQNKFTHDIAKGDNEVIKRTLDKRHILWDKKLLTSKSITLWLLKATFENYVQVVDNKKKLIYNQHDIKEMVSNLISLYEFTNDDAVLAEIKKVAKDFVESVNKFSNKSYAGSAYLLDNVLLKNLKPIKDFLK